jgi:hypothetical protein
VRNLQIRLHGECANDMPLIESFNFLDNHVYSIQSTVAHPAIDMVMIQATAKFLIQVGGSEAALEAISFVRVAQVS